MRLAVVVIMVCPSILGVERAKAYQVLGVWLAVVVYAPHLDAVRVATVRTPPALAI